MISGKPAQSSIYPLLLGEEEKALAASEYLRSKGFYVAAIRPPTVPPGTSRLRFAFTAEHSEAQVTSLANALTLGGYL
jgi:7-keto-8-aminopelargonate synthetase-like enzyme